MQNKKELLIFEKLPPHASFGEHNFPHQFRQESWIHKKILSSSSDIKHTHTLPGPNFHYT